ncbi:hypothetical protein [Borreliella tanukii]
MEIINTLIIVLNSCYYSDNDIFNKNDHYGSLTANWNTLKTAPNHIS